MTKAYAAPAGNSYSDIQEVRRLILETMGRRFRALFVSRGRREAREMQARLKRLDPETVRRDLANHQFTVWDLEKKAWRAIPLERVVHVKCGPLRWLANVGGKQC